jgi:hypothetical protein
MLNFIAIEPIVAGQRGLSELEPSARDGRTGKATWSASRLETAGEPADATRPAAGSVRELAGSSRLTVFVGVEAFQNGARVVIEVGLDTARPHEIELRAHRLDGSAALDACVLTATMGNYARLRRLWLADGPVHARDLWTADAAADTWGFLPPRTWPANRLHERAGEVCVAATPDEADPEAAVYDASVGRGWRYRGQVATQYWIAPARPALELRVNARRTYWASRAPIPGGVSFENFELQIPFEQGFPLRFGVDPRDPAGLGLAGASPAEPRRPEVGGPGPR